MEGSPGRFWKDDTNWINNCFALVVSVRFSINRPVRSRLIEGKLKYKSFPQVVRSKVQKSLQQSIWIDRKIAEDNRLVFMNIPCKKGVTIGAMQGQRGTFGFHEQGESTRLKIYFYVTAI